MKVLFLLNIPSPYRVDFLNELSKYCELTVLYEKRRSDSRSKEWNSVSNGNYEIVYINTVSTSVNSGFSLSVLKYISRKKYDCIVVGGYSTPNSIISILKMKILHIPYVLNADGGIISKEGIIKRRVKSFLIGGASKYLSTGKHTNDYFIRYGANAGQIFQYPFTTLRNADIQREVINFERKLAVRKTIGLPSDGKPIVIAVGQFIERKGLDTLIKIWNKKSIDAYLLLVGDGPLYDEYHKNKNDKIIIEGFKKKEILANYYLASDIFVLPTREDIWGLVVNEAMAYGLPVISTFQCVAACELIQDDVNGYLVDCDDIDSLYNRIDYLINNLDICIKYGGNNLNKISDYTIENMAKRTYEILCMS